MDYHTITQTVEQEGKKYIFEADFFITHDKGEPVADIQDIRFSQLPESLNCPKCGAPSKIFDWENDLSVYPHKQYYRCLNCVIIFTEDDI